SLQLGRIFTEVTLTEAESRKAKIELYDLLEKVIKDYHRNKSANEAEKEANVNSTTTKTSSVDIYEVSRRLSSDQLNAAFKAKDAQLLNGALLKTIVQLFSEKAIFGQNAAINGEAYIFEVNARALG